jgi:hypothetical protein
MTGLSRALGLGLGAAALGLVGWAALGGQDAGPQALETPACTSCDARHAGLAALKVRGDATE